MEQVLACLMDSGKEDQDFETIEKQIGLPAHLRLTDGRWCSSTQKQLRQV
jgi:hypothetical protein